MKLSFSIVVFSWVVLIPVLILSAGEEVIVKSEFINEGAPYPVSHSSTILQTSKGTLLATWFGGSQKRAPDVKIYLARFINGKWSSPEMVADGHLPDGSPIQCWNPVLFEQENGPILLFYKEGPSPNDWWGNLKISHDEGLTWSAPQRLNTGFLGPIRNKPVMLKDGSILCPCSTEGHQDPPGWRIHFERTTDLGKTWEKISVPCNSQTPDAIQPSILFHKDGTLQAIGRTKAGRIFTTSSSDQGKNWKEVSLTELPNPNSGIDAMTLKDGRFALVYNHNSTPAGLTPLNLAISENGTDWLAACVIESEPGDYSYPSITQDAAGLIHITYSWKLQKIKHVVIDLNKVKLSPIKQGLWP